MKVLFNIFLVMTLLCLAQECRADDMADDEKKLEYAWQRRISYVSQKQQQNPVFAPCKLDIYYPKNSKGFATVVWFHAGGLKRGKRYVPGVLMNQGIAVVTVDYRMYPKCKSPEFVEDAAAAVAWTFHNIGKYGGDNKKIIVGGASAGAYLSAMVGLDKSWLQKHKIDANEIAALALISGQMITHVAVREEHGVNRRTPVIDRMAPLYHVHRDAPPILLVTGDRKIELLGRYEENAYFMRMMKLWGHKAIELHEIPGKNHAQIEAASKQLLLTFVKKYAGTEQAH